MSYDCLQQLMWIYLFSQLWKSKKVRIEKSASFFFGALTIATSQQTF